MIFQRGVLMQGMVWLMFLAPFFFLTYGQVNQFTAGRENIGSIVFSWERHIPFLPVTIIPYWSLDLLYGCSLFICSSVNEQRRLVIRLMLASLIACAGFLLFPLQFTFTRPDISGVAGWLFSQLEQFDLPYNQSPSLHIILCWLVWRHFSRHLTGRWQMISSAWFAIIAFSVLTTWQHHFIDIATGFLAAIVIDWLIPYEGKWQWRTAAGKQKIVARRYLTGATICTLLALVEPLLWWPAFTLWAVAMAYARLGVSALQKSRSGKITTAAWWLLLPWRTGMKLSMLIYCRRLPPASRLTNEVYLGAYPRLKPEQRAVLDLTSEFPRARAVCGKAYRCVPMLDLVLPDVVELHRAVSDIEKLSSEYGTVLIHCALGLSRSALVASAWLIQRDPELSVNDAVASVRSARKQVVFTPEHLELLKQWKQSVRE